MTINLMMSVYAMFVAYLDEDGFRGELHRLKVSNYATLVACLNEDDSQGEPPR